jgi:hypothetical protein
MVDSPILGDTVRVSAREGLTAILSIYSAESMGKPQTHLVLWAGAALVSVTRSRQQSVPGYEASARH